MTTKSTKIDWSIRNGYYRDLLIQHWNEPASVIFSLLYRKWISNKDFEFVKKLTIKKVISQLKIQKYKKKTIKLNSYKKRVIDKKYKWYNKSEFTILLEKEFIKKSKQNNFLNRHSREESTISSTRDSIIQCLLKKVETKKISYLQSTKSLFSKEPKSSTGTILQHVLTDIHLNEIIHRKWQKYNWDTEIALKTIIWIVDQLIQKQIDSNRQYIRLELLLLWDLIGTKIHNELDLDIEPVRAAKFLASILSKIYKELIKYFKKVIFILVPGNHSETRLGVEKTDRFNENYDFLVSQYLKEFLSILGKESSVLAPSRDIPVISTVIGNTIHWFGHWDRFSTDFKRMLPIFEEYYNIKYLDFFHEGHFHNQKIRYEDGFLKMTYPCVSETSFYGQNRYGVLKREPQVGNIYNDNGDLLETYYLNDIKLNDIKYLNKITFNLDSDISEIFIDTLKYITKK